MKWQPLRVPALSIHNHELVAAIYGVTGAQNEGTSRKQQHTLTKKKRSKSKPKTLISEFSQIFNISVKMFNKKQIVVFKRKFQKNTFIIRRQGIFFFCQMCKTNNKILTNDILWPIKLVFSLLKNRQLHTERIFSTNISHISHFKEHISSAQCSPPQLELVFMHPMNLETPGLPLSITLRVHSLTNSQ